MTTEHLILALRGVGLYYECCSAAADRLALLSRQVEGLRTALEFYRDNWETKPAWQPPTEVAAYSFTPNEKLQMDKGRIARAALSSTKPEKQ